jgi:bcr-type benzoyl-CoA reductase subunit C
MNVFEPYHRVVADPIAYVRDWKRTHNAPVIGTLCSYAPEEMIMASGALGIRLFGSGQAISLADRHLQAYSCSLVRGVLDDVLAGRLDDLDGVVFPHTCDSIQRLSDIWRLNIAHCFHLDLVLPVKLTTDSAAVYLREVMEAFRRDLEKATGVLIDEGSLRAAAETGNRIRSTMRRIYDLRRRVPGAVSGGDLHAMVRAGMCMDRHEFLTAAEITAGKLETQARSVKGGLKKLFLSGGLCNMPDMYDLIEGQGAAVVADDLCSGSRFFEGTVSTEGDILEGVAGRYLRRAVCPAKHAGITARGDDLLARVRESGADGVVFAYLKFCDPHSFDYPYLKSMLEEAGIPCLLYEMEDVPSAGGQFTTRCQAFVEML